MKILSIGNYIYSNSVRKSDNNNIVSVSNPFKTAASQFNSDHITQNFFGTNLNSDVVSFSAKPYSGAIVNQTGHCAYCGCKIYSEPQLDSIVRELLNAKSEKLRGKIKSVLEKLEEAKNSSELTIAKKMANKDEIDFFHKFLELSSQKAYSKGMDIISEVYNLTEDEAFKFLKSNLTPLLATVDHISPQKEGQENIHSDMNLVETCYCCNHDIKNGTPFSEFYTLFPSIENNMPPEKFNYASAQISQLQNNGIFQKISVSNMLNLLDRLFVERNNAVNTLNSVNHRLRNSHSQISELISEMQNEIGEKNDEIAKLQAKLDILKQDDDFTAMLKAFDLQTALDKENTLLETLYTKRDNIGKSINRLRNPEVKKNSSKKQRRNAPMTEEQKQKNQQEIENLSLQLGDIISQIKSQEDVVLNCQIALDEHFLNHPSSEMLQSQKNTIDSIINAFIRLNKTQDELSDLQKLEHDYNLEKEQLIASISDISIDSFDINSYSPEEQADFENYKSLLEAKKYIEEHPNVEWINRIIRQYAKEPMDDEINKLLGKPVISDYLQSSKKKELQVQLDRINNYMYKIKNDINTLERKISSLKEKTNGQTRTILEQQSLELENKIRNLNEKQNNIKIPQLIKGLNAEIDMLRMYIEHLKAKDAKISQLIGETD